MRPPAIRVQKSPSRCRLPVASSCVRFAGSAAGSCLPFSSRAASSSTRRMPSSAARAWARAAASASPAILASSRSHRASEGRDPARSAWARAASRCAFASSVRPRTQASRPSERSTGHSTAALGDTTQRPL